MKHTLVIIFVSLLFTVSLSAQTDIRKIDFKNFSYNLRCGDADVVSKVFVNNGEYRGNKRGLDVSLLIYEIVYGDIDGDKIDEAVVLYSCGSGASYVYFRGLIFSMRGNRVKFLTSLEGGNKGDGGFEKVAIRNGHLVVSRNQLGVAGSPCCPETIDTTKYRLAGTQLRQVGRVTSRAIKT